jgi:CubicO group peptidase (beta-lactamase class C family)
MNYDFLEMKIPAGRAIKTFTIFSLAFPMMVTCRAANQGPLAMQVDALLAGLTSDREPGAAVLIVKDGSVVFERGYGITDLRTMRGIDARTNFRLASVTKQFTAAAVILLVRDGKLRYEDSLTDIFPDFPEYGRAITIRHLLTHTSGIPDYEDLMPQADSSAPVEQVQIKDAGVRELLKRQDSGKFVPGAKWAYSNSGYVLLGLVVEKASGRTFREFLRDRIFVPLKMTGTVAYEPAKNNVPNRAYGHTMEGGGWRETDQSPTSATLGDGGVYSSLSDLRKWDEALRRRTLLSEPEMRPALTPVSVLEGPPTEPDGALAAYGFGWFLNPWKGHARMWHYGETIGFRTAIQRFPDDGLTVIVLCNRADFEARALALKAAGLYLQDSQPTKKKR